MAALFHDNNCITLKGSLRVQKIWQDVNSFYSNKTFNPSGGWLASTSALARSLGNWYSRIVLPDFLTSVAILIGLCSSILPAHWMTDFGQKFAKLSWNWKMLTSFLSYTDDRDRRWLAVCGHSAPSLSAQQAKLKQRSVDIETDCSQLHIHTVTSPHQVCNTMALCSLCGGKFKSSVIL